LHTVNLIFLQVNPYEFTKEYLDDLEQLKKKIFSEIKPKHKGGQQYINGPALSSLLRLLVHYANSGSFPAVPSIWEGFLEIQRQQAVNYCVTTFKDGKL
jgi:hypothetical protein